MFGFTLKQLRYIEAAARTGSIANAANELNISQSSITAAIDKFEEALGYALFIRVPAKGISTTPSGDEAMRLIRSFIDGARHLESDMRSVGGKATGTLRLGCYGTAAPQVLPRLLKEFIRKYPAISIKIFEGDLRAMLEYLEDGEVDVALTYDLTLSDHQRFEPLFEAPAHAVLPPTIRSPRKSTSACPNSPGGRWCCSTCRGRANISWTCSPATVSRPTSSTRPVRPKSPARSLPAGSASPS